MRLSGRFRADKLNRAVRVLHLEKYLADALQFPSQNMDDHAVHFGLGVHQLHERGERIHGRRNVGKDFFHILSLLRFKQFPLAAYRQGGEAVTADFTLGMRKQV